MTPGRRARDNDAQERLQDDGPAGRSDERQDAEVVDADLDELKDELSELNTKWLRALADLDNYRKRVERERALWKQQAREEVILPILDVLDNFERAVACDVPNARGSDDPYRQGVEMILKHLKSVLEGLGVRPIETCGAEFDPNLHEAVQQVESDDHRSNEIVAELQRGYTMGDRLLRCSRVVVAR